MNNRSPKKFHLHYLLFHPSILFKSLQSALFSIFLAHNLSAAINITVNFDADFDSIHKADIESHMIAAANHWGQYIDSAPNSVIDVYINTVPGIQSAGRSKKAHRLGRMPDGIHFLNEDTAAYEIRTGVDSNGSELDVSISLGMDDPWFDPDPMNRTIAIPLGKRDIMSQLIHEFGHAIGFNGWIEEETYAGGDYSRFDALKVWKDGAAYFTGPLARQIYGGDVPLTIDNINHVGNVTGKPGDDIQTDLMNGVAYPYATRFGISDLDLAILHDLGLPVTTLVTQPIPQPTTIPEPSSSALSALSLMVICLRRRRHSRV